MEDNEKNWSLQFYRQLVEVDLNGLKYGETALPHRFGQMAGRQNMEGVIDLFRMPGSQVLGAEFCGPDGLIIRYDRPRELLAELAHGRPDLRERGLSAEDLDDFLRKLGASLIDRSLMKVLRGPEAKATE